MHEALRRCGVDPSLVDDVRYGCCMEHHDSLNVARVAALMSGLPESVPAVTVNRACISGMEAVVSGMAMIQAGMADIVLAGGVEHMSGVPYALPGARWGYKLQDHAVEDALMHALHAGSHLLPLDEEAPLDTARPPAADFLGKPYLMGHTAEFVAHRHGLTREEMDEVALRSHNNVERATEEGRFREEIVPVEVPRRKKEPLTFSRDEHFRPGLSLEDLRRLPPAFIPKTGTVTAGNSSGINDGSAGMLIMSASKARELGLTPLARIRAVGRGGCHPAVMGLSPVSAVRDLLERSGLSMDDFQLLEVNEAFAAQYLACERELGLPREITNINGSGIGLGHPVGATGARIMVTLIHAMRGQGSELGLATLCGGGGVSMACAIEAIA
jgi:acetyl-CoA C-acetyltransferase